MNLLVFQIWFTTIFIISIGNKDEWFRKLFLNHPPQTSPQRAQTALVLLTTCKLINSPGFVELRCCRECGSCDWAIWSNSQANPHAQAYQEPNEAWASTWCVCGWCNPKLVCGIQFSGVGLLVTVWPSGRFVGLRVQSGDRALGRLVCVVRAASWLVS